MHNRDECSSDGKTCALAAVQHGIEHAFAFGPAQLTTRRKTPVRFVAATLCLAWPLPADWPRRRRIKRRELRSILHPAARRPPRVLKDEARPVCKPHLKAQARPS